MSEKVDERGTSMKLITEFTDRNAGLMTSYFVLNFIILILEAIVISRLLSNIFNKDNFNKLGKFMIYFIITFLVIKILNSIKSVLYAIIIPKFNNFLKEKLYVNILDRYEVDYKELNIGNILYNFQHIPYTFNKLVVEMLQEYIPNTIAVLTCAFYLLYSFYPVGIVALLGIIIYTIVVVATRSKSINLSKEDHDVTKKSSEFIQDKLNNLFDIYTSGTKDAEKLEFQKVNDNVTQKAQENYFFSTSVSSIMDVVSLILYSVIFYLLYHFRTQTTFDRTTIILITTYYISYLNRTSNNYISLAEILGYIKESDKFIYEITKNQPQNQNQSQNQNQPQNQLQYQPKETFENIDGPIDINNISFDYAGKKIFTNFNLKIKKGEKIAIFGKSGSGKSTLIKLILGFYNISKGDILINGKKLQDYDLKKLRKEISVVNQNIKLFDSTLYDNIVYGINRNISKHEVNQVLKDLKIDIFKNLDDGIDSNVGYNGSKLSGGQKQVVNFLRSYLKDKKIMIMDEPTSALDSKTKDIILKIIKRLNNKTVIIITHDDDVLKYVNRHIELSS